MPETTMRDELLCRLGHAETPSEAADLAADFVMGCLAEALGLKCFTVSDGSETWDGDVRATVHKLLRDAGVLNDADEVARHAA